MFFRPNLKINKNFSILLKNCQFPLAPLKMSQTPVPRLIPDYLQRHPNSPVYQSANDKKKYRHITLPNGLRAFLISDDSLEHENGKNGLEHNSDTTSDQEDGSMSSGSEETESGDKMAGGCLIVRVGSFQDPPALPGLAHYLEHVILMGSEQYPEANFLDVFLNNHSGNSNACTNYEHTTYEFDIPSFHLKEALKRFSHVFIKPLFRQESLETELEPVNTEFLEGISDDGSRIELLFSSLAKKSHPLSIFSWGNIESLREGPKKNNINVREQMLEFWRKYYVPENMALLLQAQMELDEMEDLVTTFFSKIQSNPSAQIIKTSPFEPCLDFPYRLEDFNKLHIIDPVDQIEKLSLIWWMPCQLQHYKTHPLKHIGSLIGHEGKGSLFSLLRRKGLALELCSGNDESNFDHNQYQSTFGIEVKLTQKGLDQIGEVVRHIFAYLDLLHQHGPQMDYFHEEVLIYLNDFRFKEEMEPDVYCKKIAENFYNVPVEDLLINHLIFDYDEDILKECIGYLTYERAHFILLSQKAFKEFKSDIHVEPWMKTKYRIEEAWSKNWCMDKNYFAELQKHLHFPLRNDYIPSNFTIKQPASEDSNLPKNISSNPNYNLWFKKDQTFKYPKAVVILYFISPVILEIKKRLGLEMFADILELNLSEKTYAAISAGYACELSQVANGFVIKITGFNEKMGDFIDLIAESVMNFEFDAVAFSNVKSDAKQSFSNAFHDSRVLAKSLRFSLLDKKHKMALEKTRIN